MSFVLLLTTTSSSREAQKLARILVQQKAAACVTVSAPVRSFYQWQKKINRSQEWMLFIKTRKSLYLKVEKLILKHHSYDVPEIITLEIGRGNRKYLQWLESSTRL